MQILATRRRVNNLLGIDMTFIDAYRRQRKEEGAAPKTIFTETMIIRQVVNFARNRRMIRDDPLNGLKLKRPKPTEQPCWSRDEVQKILLECNNHYRPRIVVKMRSLGLHGKTDRKASRA